MSGNSASRLFVPLEHLTECGVLFILSVTDTVNGFNNSPGRRASSSRWYGRVRQDGMEGCAVTKKLTIRDIARLAGVSTATVSRVLNQKPDVDPETRERVMDVVNAHHYVPNMTASSLAGGRSRLLGVLVPSLTWPLMPNIMQGIAVGVVQTTD